MGQCISITQRLFLKSQVCGHLREHINQKSLISSNIMGETKKRESESADPTPMSPPHSQQLSQLILKGKEPENVDTSSPVWFPRTDSKDSTDRDAVLARVESEKRFALIKAWEESEKTKSENKAIKMQAAVGLWESTKKASAEAKIKRIEEKLERKKAESVEKMQNTIAEIHRAAEEKRAVIEALKGEELLKVEETAAKYRTRGYPPRKFLACFSGYTFF